MTGDDNTPPIQLGPATDDSLVADLRREPTREEKDVIDLLQASSGAHVPFHMFAKIALRTHRLWAWIGRKDRLYRSARNHAWAAILSAGASLGSIGAYMLHRHDEIVTAAERAAADERVNEVRREATAETIKQLQKDIDQLREKLLRMSGALEPHPRKPDSSIFTAPDKVSTNQKESHHDLVSNP
jgi:hypothetical protein